uniref:EXS domain-containing protein n=1 Tax=Heterorhabditis bacteriophora TaxID=37862 RepID=A0A1I7X8V8_HETBA
MFCLVMLPYMMTAFFYERIFSTIYIKDYEVKTRKHIPHVIFATITILIIYFDSSIGIVLSIIVLLTVREGRVGLENGVIYALHCGRWTLNNVRKTKVLAKNEMSMYFEQLESAWK